MNRKKTNAALYLLVAIFLLSYCPAFADLADTPTFLLPNDHSSTHTFLSERPVANGYSLVSQYFDGYDASGKEVWVRQETGAVLTDNSGSMTLIQNANNYSYLYADPRSFDTKSISKAQTDGALNYHVWGQSQAWNWFVLTGGAGEVALTADILVQGKAYANNGAGGNAASIFNVSLGFLSDPADLVQDYVVALAGTVGWEEAGFGSNNTVDEDVFWDTGDEVQTVNYIIRSQPFTVTFGVPFRLSVLTLTEAFAGPGDWGEAWADFYDPRLVTSDDYPDITELTMDGFSVLLPSGEYSTLGARGYSLARVPEPASILLFGLGLIGLAGLRRKIQ